MLSFRKKDKKDSDKSKDRPKDAEKKSGLATVVLQTTAKTALWAAKKSAGVAVGVGVEAVKMSAAAMIKKKEPTSDESKDKPKDAEKKSGLAAVVLQTTAKTALWAAKKSAGIAVGVGVEAVKMSATAIINKKEPTSDESNNPWEQKNTSWLSETGKHLLQKMYEPHTTFADAHHAGSLISVHNGYFSQSGLKKKAEHKPLYHQLNRSSLVKTIKTANRLVNGKKEHANLRREYLISIAAIMWHLHDLGIQANQELKRGSFKIVDPDGKLFQFLMGYARYATGSNHPEFLSGANDFAYRRDPKWYLSSHYTHSSFDSEQYGIDMRFWGGHPTLDILPNQSSHLLFGRVTIHGEKYTFIKPEQIGLGHPLEYLEHASHLFFNSHKEGDNIRRESVIPSDIEKAFEAYRTITRLKKPHPYTISNMTKVINENDNSLPSQQKAIREFGLCLQKHGYEHDAEYRTGKEVIINLTHLKKDEQVKSPLRLK